MLKLPDFLDLFYNGDLFIYCFICMIISLSDLVSMCKIQKNPYFQTRSERLIIIHMKNLTVGRHYERGL